MLLRRVIEHVKTQNWTAVGLDFLIVVTGVFIGLQVTGWNEARQDIAQAKVLKARLLDDFAEQKRLIEFSIDYNETAKASAERAEVVLQSDIAGDDAALIINAFRATQFPGYPRYRGAYDELVATGKIHLIDNQDYIRLAVLLYEEGVYDWALDEIDVTQYRERFRMLVPSEIHQLVNNSCGDKTDGGSFAVIRLDYPCNLEAPEEIIRETAQALRDDPVLLQTLRLRIADLDTTIASLKEVLEFLEVRLK